MAPDRQLRRMRDRRFVSFDWDKHWVRAFALLDDSWAMFDLFPPVQGYRPAPSPPSGNKTYYISLTRQQRDWSNLVIQRDHGCCQHCNSAARLEAHNLWPQGWFHHLRYLPRNGVTLCHSCHASVQRNTEVAPDQFRWLITDVQSINADIERDDFWEHFTAGHHMERLRQYGIAQEY